MCVLSFFSYLNLFWSCFSLSNKIDKRCHRSLLHSLWKSNLSNLHRCIQYSVIDGLSANILGWSSLMVTKHYLPNLFSRVWWPSDNVCQLISKLFFWSFMINLKIKQQWQAHVCSFGMFIISENQSNFILNCRSIISYKCV